MEYPYKFYWKNKFGHTRCYITDGYDAKFTTLKKLFEIARKDYPEVSEDEFEVTEIINSDRIKGFKCITFLINREPLDDYEYRIAS